MLKEVSIFPLKQIKVKGGDVLHAYKKDDIGLRKFGECYISFIKYGHIKGWKKHLKNSLNIVVPLGKIKFVIFDDSNKSKNKNPFKEFVLCRENYCRLFIPPKLWVAFQGLDKKNSYLLNMIENLHDPNESINQKIENISYNWEFK